MVGRGKQIVEVGKQLAELVGVGIPVAEQRQGEDVAQQQYVLVGTQVVEQPQQRHAAHYHAAAFEQLQRVAHL